MMCLKRMIAASFAALLALVPAVSAEAADKDMLSIGIGHFDNQWMDRDRFVYESAELRIDYRWGVSLLPFTEPFLKVKPWAGVEFNTDQWAWGGAGFWLDIPIGKTLYLAPSTGVGLYRRGNSKDLGAAIEFRSTFEAGFKLDNDSRFGLFVSHLSNAGIDNYNPGVNIIGAQLSFSLGR